MEARIQLCNFLMAILNFRVTLEDQCLAICTFLPVTELRAFSVLTSRFRSASTLAWSNDILENERVLLAIVQNGQPQFLSRAIKDSGIGNGSLGRFLLRATDAGGQYLCDHWRKLFGDLHAVIRKKDAVMITGGMPHQAGIYVRLHCEREDILAWYVGNCGCLVHFPASARDSLCAELAEECVYPKPAWQRWQESFWMMRCELGIVRYHVALSTSAVPPADGWIILGNEISFWILALDGDYQNFPQIRQVQPRDLQNGTRNASDCGKYRGEQYLPLV